MIVLGLQGSPRREGNTARMLDVFLERLRIPGVRLDVLNPCDKKIMPCRGCRYCETKGYCAIDNDDMTREIYPLLRRADLVVMATPIFFYSIPAQLKALVDRTQTLWSRKYMLKLADPGSKWRKGFLLAVGATKGANLFEGAGLTAKYFFDGIGAAYNGILAYRRIEKPGEILKHETAVDDLRKKAEELSAPFLGRKRLIFICSGNAARSQMAAAFAQRIAGDMLEVLSGGTNPAKEVSGLMQQVMAEKSVDMAFRTPVSAEDALMGGSADYAVTMGCGASCPVLPGADIIEWDLPDPKGKPIEFMRGLRDEIEKKVTELIAKL